MLISHSRVRSFLHRTLQTPDNLAIYLEEEFSVTLEDGSEVQVAEDIFKMYENCAKGDTTMARQMVAQAESAVAFSSQFPVQMQTTEHDDDDDDDMTDDQNAPLQGQPTIDSAPMAIPHDYNSKPLFGEAPKVHIPTTPVRQLGETVEPVQESVEMDEDGFAPVKPKGRRKQ